MTDRKQQKRRVTVSCNSPKPSPCSSCQPVHLISTCVRAERARRASSAPPACRMSPAFQRQTDEPRRIEEEMKRLMMSFPSGVSGSRKKAPPMPPHSNKHGCQSPPHPSNINNFIYAARQDSSNSVFSDSPDSSHSSLLYLWKLPAQVCLLGTSSSPPRSHGGGAAGRNEVSARIFPEFPAA